MARPARSAREVQAIRRALAMMPISMSKRSKARCLAHRVVAETLAADQRQDPVELALAAALAAVDDDPIIGLATDLAGDLARHRLRRFEARGCQQLSAEGWKAETNEIASILETHLAEKFRRA